MSKLIIVHPSGPVTATIAIIGESPGLDEIHNEPDPAPFSGQAGLHLDQLLSQSGILRSQCRFLYLIPIQIPKNDITLLWEDKAQTKPKPILEKGIRLLRKNLSEMPNLKVIIVLEEPLNKEQKKRKLKIKHSSMYILTLGKQDGITKWRGSISIIELCRVINRIFEGKNIQITDDVTIKLISTFHPSFALKQWNVNPLIVHDLKRAKDEVDNGLGLPERILNAYPTRYEIDRFFRHYTDRLSWDIKNVDKEKHQILYCDIETFPDPPMITRISFSFDPKYAISIPFFNLDTMTVTHWHYDEWVWDVIRKIMANSPIGGQNFGSYDRLWLYKLHNIVINNFVHDTMIAQHNIMCGLGSGGDENKAFGSSPSLKPFSLGMLTSIYTREPYYKGIGKITKTKKPSDSSYGRYSCLDPAITCEVGQKQIQTSIFKKHIKFFNHEMKLLNGPIWYMMRRGIKIDLELREKLRTRYANEIEWLELTAKDMTSSDINLASTQQLAVLLYDKMRLKGPVSRSTRAEELFILKAKYPTNILLDLITQHRRIAKIRSTILDAKIDSDGRMRCSYSPTTISGRFKSYESPFGSGTNLQNVPSRTDKNIRPMFIPDKGNYLVETDLKGAEIYPVAYLSGDIKMISQLESGTDIHSETAKIVLGKREISESDRGTGKTVRHGAHYCMSSIGVVRILRLWNEINIKKQEANSMLNRIHSYNPSLRLWHKKVETDLYRQNNTLINALGREIKFFDRRGPDLYRKATNWLAQSFIADLINTIMNKWFDKYNDNCIDMVEVEPGIYEQDSIMINDGYQTKAELLLQLHDAFYTQCPKSFIHQHLSNLAECFNYPVTINNHTFIIPVEFKVTEYWGGERIKI